MKLPTSIFFSKKPKYLFNPLSAFSWPALLLHSLEIWLSKFSLLSISNTNKRTLLSELIPSISISVGLLFCPFLSIMIARNFSRFTIILFILNQSAALFASLCKSFTSFDYVPDKLVIVLSSGKLCNLKFLITH